MIGLVDADHEPLAVPALNPEVVVGGANGCLVGDRPSGAEEDFVEVRGGQVRDPGRQGRRGQVGVAGEDLPVAHPGRLLRDGFHHLLSAVTNVDTPQPGVGVEQPVAVGVLQVAPATAHVHVVAGHLGGGQAG